MDKNYYLNLLRPSLWFEVTNLCFQTTSELDAAKYCIREEKGKTCSIKWPKNSKDRTRSQLQLTGIQRRSDRQVSHPDPCTPPAQQIDQKGLSSVETTAMFESSWWMSLGTLPPRVTAGPSLCPGLNLMYDPGAFWAILHINTHKLSSSPNSCSV